MAIQKRIVGAIIGVCVFVGAPEVARWVNGGAFAQTQSISPQTDIHVRADPNSTSPTVGIKADGMTINPSSGGGTRVMIEGGKGDTTGVELHGPLIIGAPPK